MGERAYFLRQPDDRMPDWRFTFYGALLAAPAGPQSSFWLLQGRTRLEVK